MENNLDILLAMQDDDFQKIINNDTILNELQKQKNSRQIEYFQLISIFTKSFTVCGIKIKPITPMLWSFLYCIGNKYITNPAKAENIDTDVFMYLLHNGVKVIDDDLFHSASGFCESLNIDYEQAKYQLIDLIILAFRPLSMFPKNNINSEQARYNVDWLTKIVSMVCQLTNKDSEYVMYEMSLTEALSYVVQYARRNDLKGQIRRRNSDEIDVEIYKRTMKLGTEYYNKKYCN